MQSGDEEENGGRIVYGILVTCLWLSIPAEGPVMEDFAKLKLRAFQKFLGKGAA